MVTGMGAMTPLGQALLVPDIERIDGSLHLLGAGVGIPLAAGQEQVVVQGHGGGLS